MSPRRLPAALVFDFDGTLVDTETPEYESVRLVWASHGHDFALEAWTQWVGTADAVPWLDELERAVGEPLDREALRQQARAHHREIVATVQPLPGVARLLAEADAAGVPVAIASNAPAWWVEQHLERLGLLDQFGRHGAVVTVDRVARPKPHPEPYRTAVARLGVAVERSVAFEDSATGVAAACAAGLYTVAVAGPMTAGHDLGAAHRRLASLAEVDLAALAVALDTRAEVESSPDGVVRSRP